jgi:hypothetical protein
MKDVDMERMMKAYAQDCAEYRNCLKYIEECFGNEFDDDWVVRAIKSRIKETYQKVNKSYDCYEV